ncbi:MAG: ASCH domain-containing protein [Myxococcota bacterium]|nr:ASCH domain-containing protein [Myxococcota bacterium]
MEKFPILLFAPEFVDSILSGKKSATTRLVRAETLSDLAPSGCVFAQTPESERPFARLEIHGMEDRKFSEIDDNLAHIENLESATELQDALKQFYPDIVDEDLVRVIFFTCF